MKWSRLTSAVLSLLVLAAVLTGQGLAGVNDPKIPEAPKEKAAPGATGASQPVFLGQEVLYEKNAPEGPASPLGYGPQAVPPEVPTRVTLSSVDVNRIVCEEGPVRDVVYSKEKGLSVTVEGSSVFVKYSIAVDPATGQKIFAEFPTELYVVCASGTVYTLVAVPERVPAQTVMLKSALPKVEKVKALFQGMSHEQKVVNLIRWAYREEIPEVLTVRDVGVPLELFEGLKVVLRRTVDAEGEGLRLKEYVLTSLGDTPLRVSEKDFLRPEISRSPLALSLTSLQIGKEPVRLFVVERRIEE